MQGSFDIHSQHTESEGYDRSSLELPGMQETFVRLLARLTSTPLIVVLVHGVLSRAGFPNAHRCTCASRRGLGLEAQQGTAAGLTSCQTAVR